jgi:hypothetical protein
MDHLELESTPEATGARREGRFAADFDVRLVWVDMTYAGPARLVDVSLSGGRIVVSDRLKAPRDIYLVAYLPGEGEPRRLGGVVRWQVGETLGVRFDPPLSAATVRALARLNGPQPS